jgi:hypothetical protein
VWGAAVLSPPGGSLERNVESVFLGPPPSFDILFLRPLTGCDRKAVWGDAAFLPPPGRVPRNKTSIFYFLDPIPSWEGVQERKCRKNVSGTPPRWRLEGGIGGCGLPFAAWEGPQKLNFESLFLGPLSQPGKGLPKSFSKFYFWDPSQVVTGRPYWGIRPGGPPEIILGIWFR